MRKIKPQTLKGFRDFLPEDMRVRNYVIDTFKKVFERYGYEPLETPALEYTYLMLGISGKEAEKQFFSFKDRGGRDVMLKFEVMVSMCRVVAQYKDKIVFPFKRYQIQRCWRAEKPQKGRYREFTQCDADTVGISSMIADAEFIQMGIEAMKELGFKNFVTLISNRKFLTGLAKFVELDPSLTYRICMSLDKFRKIGLNEVKKEMIKKIGLPPDKADKILRLISTKGENEKLIGNFKKKMANIPEVQEGLTEIEEIFDYLKAAGVEKKYYRFDPSIARGLAHYTGPIWEVEVVEGSVGSIAGCGRYDNVIGSYLGGKEQIPATGGSFGIERIIEILKSRKMINFPKSTAKVLVTFFDKKSSNESIKIANKLRKEGISTILYPNLEAKLNKQLKYADKKSIPFVVIIGPDEIKKNVITLRDMKAQSQAQLSLKQLLERLAQI